MTLARLLALVLLLPVVGMATAAEEIPEPGVLFLRGDPAGGRSHNFTTYAPDANDTGASLPMLTSLNNSRIGFATTSVPADWTVRVDAAASVELWISGLDRVVGALDPTSASRHPGQVVVQASLRHGDDLGGPFARGEVGVDVSAAAPQEGPRRVVMTLAVERSVTFTADTSNGASFLLDVLVPGYNRQDTPLVLHVASSATPSRLVVETFPVEAFRAWEAGERSESTCGPGVSPCETTDPTDGPDDGATKRSPLPWLVGLGAVFAAVSLVLLRSRR